MSVSGIAKGSFVLGKVTVVGVGKGTGSGGEVTVRTLCAVLKHNERATGCRVGKTNSVGYGDELRHRRDDDIGRVDRFSDGADSGMDARSFIGDGDGFCDRCGYRSRG